jgi:POT family proton-dependent oligopeptide transporter
MDAGLILMLVAWVVVGAWISIIIFSQKKYHPKALFTLFFAEMWERFNFYGMRAILTLYMIKVLFDHMSQTEADERAIGIYGAYNALVYLTPVLGGMLADKILGFRRSIVWGGILMACGQVMLIFSDTFQIIVENDLFYIGLSLIVVGNGYFKPNISSFLGTFYDKNDPRKDGAFTIFYMGINVGAFLAPITCGYLGETYDWDWGFGLAAAGMLAGLFAFRKNIKNFAEKGISPKPEFIKKKILLGLKPTNLILIGSVLVTPLIALLLNVNESMTLILTILGILVIGYLLYEAIFKLDKVEGQRLAVVIILAFFHTLFWAFFEQAGSSLTLFTERNVDRTFFGSELKTSIFQSVNPLFIITLAPAFTWLWAKLNKLRMDPYTPFKFAWGLLQLGIGFGVLVLGAKLFASSSGMVPLAFLVIAYFLHTTGELCLSPVGLSMVTKLSPGRIVGFVMGAWFLSISFAHHLAAFIAKLTAAPEVGNGEVASPLVTLPIYTDVYWQSTLFIIAAAGLLFLLAIPIKRMMHGIH